MVFDTDHIYRHGVRTRPFRGREAWAAACALGMLQRTAVYLGGPVISPFLAFGKAPLVLLCVAAVSGSLAWITRPRVDGQKPDLVFTIFAKEHKNAYDKVIPAFERAHGVHVQMQVMDARALQSRLQAAMQSGAEVPDVVELCEPSIGYFTAGPLADVGFVDLTDRIRDQGLRDRMVTARFALWSSRGHCFALPHDVHPVALAYRRDLVEQLGIDVTQLDTWDKFLAVGRTVAVDADGDGSMDRHCIDLPTDGGFGLQLLLWQAGGGYVDADGRVTFDNDIALRTVLWYVHAVRGKNRIAVSCGWGQIFTRAVTDGLALFFLVPDWRSKQIEADMPQLKGKLSLMPMPAWQAGGRRTSTWGGTGLAITKAGHHQALAWELAQELYLNESAYGSRYASTNILPPVRSAWKLPELSAANAFYGNQAIGSLYAELAPQVPEIFVTAYEELARSKFSEAFLRVALRFEAEGDAGLEAFAQVELTRCADYVRTTISRNRFLSSDIHAGEAK